MRARKVVTRSGKRFRGKFPSVKLKQTIHWESFIERDAILHFDHHPLVLSFQEQPSKEFYYDDDGQQRVCYPDFLLRFVGGNELLIEIKPKKELRKKAIRQKLDLIARRFAEQGRAYRVLNEEDLRREPLFGNLHRIRAALLLNRRSEALDDAHAALMCHGVLGLGELARLLGHEDTVLALVATSVLRMNLEQPLTPTSLVWLASNAEAGDGAFSI